MRKIAETYDPVTGIREDFHHDEVDKKVTIYREQDVSGILKANKEALTHSGRVKNKETGGMRHVARIPLIVIEQWKEEGFDWFHSTKEEKRAKLNDPDNKFLRVCDGRL